MEANYKKGECKNAKIATFTAVNGQRLLPRLENLRQFLLMKIEKEMDVKEILAQLEAKSDDKMRKHHAKFGATGVFYGVKMGDIRAMASKIKTNHSLGLALWDTGVMDARLLAILIMKADLLSAAELTRLVASESYGQVADWLYTHLIKNHPEKDLLREPWLASEEPMCRRAGWSLTSGRVARQAEGLDLDALLTRIETEMPSENPAVQWTMNATLANIGIHHPAFRERALAIGNQLGIYRDYPVSKGCTSPFAPIWIAEMVKRQEKG